MNTRLEIASRVLPGMVSHSGNYIFPDDKLARSAMNLADALIAAEEATRKAEPTIAADEPRLAAEIRTFICELEQRKDVGVAVIYVIQELRIMLERENARRKQ